MPTTTQLPFGHSDWSDLKTENFIGNKVQAFFRPKLAALRDYLKPFRDGHPEWFYGSADTKDLCCWYVDYDMPLTIAYKTPNERVVPAHMQVSFWLKAPTPIEAGRNLTLDEVDVLARFLAEFVSTHRDLRCTTRINGWKVTCSFFKK